MTAPLLDEVLAQAERQQWSALEFATRLLGTAAEQRRQRSLERRLRDAHFRDGATLETFDWQFNAATIARGPIEELASCAFVRRHDNVIVVGQSGLGKSHLMTALGYAACQRGHSVLFTGAIDIINTLAAAHAAGGLKRALAAYVRPEVLCIDELGYLPIDKFGADCLFQIISHRYERGATLLTTNRIYKQWASIFNGDATLTSALLDRLLDHVETVVIEGKGYRGQTHAEA